MNKTIVIKRDGREESFAISKFKQQARFACSNTDIEPERFEVEVKMYMPKKLKTTDIQQTLLYTAKSKISAEEPDWNYVAGRVMMWDIYGNVFRRTKIRFSNWLKLVDHLVDLGFYKKEIKHKLDKFNVTDKDISYGTWKEVSFNNPDFNLKLSQTAIFLDKYIIKQENEPIEYPFMIHIANAAILATSREEFFDFYKKLSNNVLSLATPFLSNLRRPDGNTGSCFVGSGTDSLLGLTKSWEDISIISKEGGGVGWDLTEVRPGNTYTDNIYKSNKITKWTKIFDDIIEAVNQKGVRKGALTLALPWWHLDFVDFLEAKSEASGDIRNKTFDIYPQALVDNYFIDAVINDKSVYQVNQYLLKKDFGLDLPNAIDDEAYNIHEKVEELVESELIVNSEISTYFKKISARALWKKILWLWIETGEMYVVHKDGINISNYLKYTDSNLIARCANLCNESFSINKSPTKWSSEVDLENDSIKHTTYTNGLYHACNLTSINVVKLIDCSDDEIKDVVASGVRILDRSIDAGTFPVREAELSAIALRNIGLGILGVADYMAYYKKDFAKEDGQNFMMSLMEKIAYYAYSESIELAKKEGHYPLFNPSNYKYGLFGKSYQELNKTSKEVTGNNFDWRALGRDIRKYGIRNFYLLAEAPNTSTGLAMGVSASYLPVVVIDGTQELAHMVTPILPVFVKERFWYYKERFNYNMVDIVKYTRKFQYFIDTGVSMELNLNPDITRIDELSEAFLEGFKTKELKAIYYNKTTSCSTCAN